MNKRQVAIVCLAAIAFGIFGYILYPQNEKTIEVVECKRCEQGNCESEKYGSGGDVTLKYVINKDKVVLLMTGDDGGAYIHDLSKCQILPTQGFAFSCESRESSGSISEWREFSSSASYNGSGGLEVKVSNKIYRDGKFERIEYSSLNYEETCKVK